jgi:hypothetical protein
MGCKAAVGYNGFGPQHLGASETHAHEVGHNHGRWHAPGCGASQPDPSYPYVSDGKGYIGNTAFQNYGFDIQEQSVYPYDSTYDMMSYCGPEWISDYTYEALWAYDRSQAATISKEAPPEYGLMISGWIDPASNQAMLHPV